MERLANGIQCRITMISITNKYSSTIPYTNVQSYVCLLLYVPIIYPSLVLVQPRKTRPCLTERLLMGLKESNQSNKRPFQQEWLCRDRQFT